MHQMVCVQYVEGVNMRILYNHIKEKRSPESNGEKNSFITSLVELYNETKFCWCPVNTCLSVCMYVTYLFMMILCA